MAFHQINYSTLSSDKTIQSFPRSLSEEDLAAARKVRTFWNAPPLAPGKEEPAPSVVTAQLSVPPGEARYTAVPAGPAVIRRLIITPDFCAISSIAKREQLLRDLILTVHWDDAAAPSLEVPLGDFFGSFWRPLRFSSIFIGMHGQSFYSRLPMPFRKSARIGIRNESDVPAELKLQADIWPLESWDGHWGYLHACWRRTGPDRVGAPHAMLDTSGRGKYVGCVLSTVSLDKSWWLLESNEYMRRDNQLNPQWLGTGLEDYFNCGWYYRNPTARPLSGLLFMAPFRTVQYRFHLSDDPHFSSRMHVEFERGPNQRSRGYMESVAYYYLDKPALAASTLLSPRNRRPPDDGFEPVTIMRELVNQERFGDHQGAHDHVSAFLETYTNHPYANLLRLRQIAYRERMHGFEAVRHEYEAFRKTCTDENAAAQAERILWFHEDPTHALLAVYANAQTRVFLDGRLLAQIDHPEIMFVLPATLSPGRHAICLEATMTRSKPWVLATLRTHQGYVGTSPDWRRAVEPEGNYLATDFDDSAWKPSQWEFRGPPEVPYVKYLANAWVDMQARAEAIRISSWEDQANRKVVFRNTFVIEKKDN